MNYEDTLYALSRKNPELVVMTAENRAIIRGLPKRMGDRFIDVGIAESTLVGAAAGLAKRGRIPVAHALAAFLVFRAYEFVRNDVAILGLPVKLMGFIPGLQSTCNGPTHQAIEDIALMRALPGMRIWCPADQNELNAGLERLIDDPHPYYVRLSCCPEANPNPTPWRPGEAQVFPGGSDVALITYGPLLKQTLACQKLLRDKGIAATVVHARSIEPLDEEAVLGAVVECGVSLVIEDHIATGGLWTALCELMVRRGVSGKRVDSVSLGKRWFRPLPWDDLLPHEGFDEASLATRVTSFLETA